MSDNQKFKLKRVNNTLSTTVQDYLGSYMPETGGFRFCRGALYLAVEKGFWFLADEFNLADPAVMSLLLPLLEGRSSLSIPGTGKVIPVHPNFRFFAAQNASSFSGRHRLPPSLRNRFMEIQVKDYSEEEMKEIIGKRREKNEQPPTQEFTNALSSFYALSKSSPFAITMREIIKWTRRRTELQSSWAEVGFSLLSSRVSSSETGLLSDLVQFLTSATTAKLLPQLRTSPDFSIVPESKRVKFSEGSIHAELPYDLLQSSLWKSNREPPKSFRKQLVRLVHAVKMKEPVLLVGPSSFKSKLLDTYLAISGVQPTYKIHLSPNTQASDLLGLYWLVSYSPSSFYVVFTSLFSCR
jgi:midasin